MGGVRQIRVCRRRAHALRLLQLSILLHLQSATCEAANSRPGRRGVSPDEQIASVLETSMRWPTLAARAIDH
ncbi:hypothetical protein EVAR_92578_1 [Eumeta japonica]|uniref:Secreted protein n=1 Tax=Eumeta variegata TaxID=151549 RepID=A0A4C1SWN0_EUMVA|nr:hypothetical protein EVAR_92578_1 [Eumeta japonica]